VSWTVLGKLSYQSPSSRTSPWLKAGHRAGWDLAKWMAGLVDRCLSFCKNCMHPDLGLRKNDGQMAIGMKKPTIDRSLVSPVALRAP
jgi:hypothetical protein